MCENHDLESDYFAFQQLVTSLKNDLCVGKAVLAFNRNLIYEVG